MKFMNDYEVRRARQMYADHPVLGPATQTLRTLQAWANNNSDGWAYWPTARAARGLMELITRDGTNAFYGGPREDVTVEEYRKALRAVKAFRTRAVKAGMPGFEIEEI